MKKIIFALIAIVAVATSCSKVQPSNLDYSKYTNKATLIVQTQLSGSNYGGILVDITVGDVHLQRTSDASGLIEEVIGFEGSSMTPVVAAQLNQNNIYYYGTASTSKTVTNDDVVKITLNLTQKSL